MSISVSEAFVTGYEEDVHIAFQRRGAKLRHTIRRAEGVVGSTHVFQKIGTGVATTKARNGNVTPMNVTHTNVTANLVDSYAPDYADKLDLDKLTIDEKSALVQSGAFALGRKVDTDIITQLDATTLQETSGTTGDFSLTKVLTAMAQLGNNDVFEEGRMWAIVPWTEWNKLMLVQQFAQSDWVTDKPFLEAGMAKRWLGTIWMPHSGLETLVSGSVAKSYWWHESAVGNAMGTEIQSDINWIAEKVAWLLNNMMSQGSILIDANGVIEIRNTRA